MTRDPEADDLCTFAEAAVALHCSVPTVTRHVRDGDLAEAEPGRRRTRGQGRPATRFVSLDSVGRLRARHLAELGAVEMTIAEQAARLGQERDELQAAVSSLSRELANRDAAVGESPGLVEELQRRNGLLEAEVARLNSALDAGILAQQAMLDQVRQLQLPSSVGPQSVGH